MMHHARAAPIGCRRPTILRAGTLGVRQVRMPTEFRILGPLEAWSDGRLLELGGRKQRALLAALLLEANAVVSSERLIDALWPDDPPETAQKALQVYISALRKLLGKDRIQTRPPGYAIRLEPEELDLTRFQRLQEEGRLHEALAAWRGAPLAEFASDRFARAEIARLEELRLVCLEERIASDLARNGGEVIGELERLVELHPLRERLREQLMIALYRAGRQAEALEVFRAGRRALVDEIGIEPGRSLRELQQAILRQDPVLDAASAHRPEPRRGVLVGREAELASLLGGLENAVAGRGRAFLLVGEPGIGKSRLLDEVSAAARARGARVLVGRCWEAGGAPPYWPWVQSVRSFVRDADPDTLRPLVGPGASTLAQLLPELRELYPDLPDAPSESEGARFRLFDAFASFLVDASRSTPILLVLDDLHAADEPSLLLLQFVVRQLDHSRLLVIGAYRDLDPRPSEPLREAVSELLREPVTTSIPIQGLGEGDVARFIELTSGEAPSEELVAAIHEETDGNPLFVGEIVRLFATQGGVGAGATATIAIPESVRDVIARRLRQLSDECNAVLVHASVLGREFALAALAGVCRVTEDELLDRLDEAMRERVVSDVPVAHGRLRFAHVLIRDALYESVTSVRRVSLHRSALAALEKLYRDQAVQHSAELAYHALAGSEFERGVEYARRAADQALDSLAYEEAVRFFESALEALSLSAPGDDASRCELLLLVGESQLRAGNLTSAKQAFLAAAEIARARGLARELATAALGYAGRVVWARAAGDERLVPLLEEGLEALPDEEVRLRARLLARLAGALRDERERDRRAELSRRAVALARDSGDLAALAYALDGQAAAIQGPDVVHESLAIAEELCELAKRIGDMERLVHGHSHRVVALLMLGDLAGAERETRASSLIADRLKQPAQRWLVMMTDSLIALSLGKLDEVERLIEEARAVGERALPNTAMPVYWMQRYCLCDFRGGLESVVDPIAAVAAEYPARPIFRCTLSHVLARLGRSDEARQIVTELAPKGFAVIPFDQEWLYAVSTIAETSILVDAEDAYEVLYSLLTPWVDYCAADLSEGFRGAVSRYLGLLAAPTGRVAEARHHFHDAVERNARMGVRPWLARTKEDYGRVLLESGDEPERALGLLDDALVSYNSMGMTDDALRAAAFRDTVRD
jgi:eukaryotic-like serine/threonine-protein kinase